jgi:hypothetical protein
MMKINGSFLSITIVFCMGLIACANYVGPDETGRICEPGVMLADSFGCLPGCDLDASAYFCTADGRGQECRIVAGRVCRTDPGCPGGGASCSAGVGACQRFGHDVLPRRFVDRVALQRGRRFAGVRDLRRRDRQRLRRLGRRRLLHLHAHRRGDLRQPRQRLRRTRSTRAATTTTMTTVTAPCRWVRAARFTARARTPGRTVGDDCDDTNAGRCPSATEICGNGIDEDCNGSDLACAPTCTITNGGVEICDGRDNDCDGSPTKVVSARSARTTSVARSASHSPRPRSARPARAVS